MGNGILLCGLNGAGKSTIGRALAQSLRYHFIDHEDLFFPDGVYAAPRSREEACCLLMQRVAAHPNFVLACVKGNFGDALLPQLRLAVGDLEDLLALGVCLSQTMLILLLERGGIGLGLVGIGVEVVDLLLPGVDHVLDRLEQQLFHELIKDQKIEQRKEARPEIDADKALKPG